MWAFVGSTVLAIMAYKAEFDAVIDAISSVIGEESLRNSVIARLQHEYDEPPVEGVSLRARRHVTDPDIVRKLLFSPSEDEDSIGIYPDMIAPLPKALPANHPARSAQSAFLALLYLHHLRKWRLAVGFIKAGGLRALAGLLRSRNLFIRTQAIEVLLQLTSHEGMNWFEAPVGEEECRLHQQLLAVGTAAAVTDAEADDEDNIEDSQQDGQPGQGTGAQDTPLSSSADQKLGRGFLASLCRNWDCGAPGASFNCLQLLAFWLSWARKLYTEDKPLYLSRALLDRLKQWAERPVGENPVPVLPRLPGETAEDDSGSNAAAGAGGSAQASNVPASLIALSRPPAMRYSGPEECELARQLYDDFSSFPCAEDVTAEEAGGNGPTAAGVVSADAGGKAGARVGQAVAGLTASAVEPAAPTTSANPQASAAAASAAPTPAAPAPSPQPAQALDPMSRATQYKEEGNSAFKGGKWAAASKAYGQGIAVLRPLTAMVLESSAGSSNSSSTIEGPDGTTVDRSVLVSLASTLHSNRAASRLRMSGFGPEVCPSHGFLKATRAMIDGLARDTARAVMALCEQGHGAAGEGVDVDDASGASTAGGQTQPGVQALAACPVELRCLVGALLDATATLALVHDHPKAIMRRAQALAGLHRFRQSVAATRTCLGRRPLVGMDKSSVAAAAGLTEVQGQASKFLAFVTVLQGAEWELSGSAGPDGSGSAVVVATSTSRGAAVDQSSKPQPNKPAGPSQDDLEAEILAALLGGGPDAGAGDADAASGAGAGKSPAIQATSANRPKQATSARQQETAPVQETSLADELGDDLIGTSAGSGMGVGMGMALSAGLAGLAFGGPRSSAAAASSSGPTAKAGSTGGSATGPTKPKSDEDDLEALLSGGFRSSAAPGLPGQGGSGQGGGAAKKPAAVAPAYLRNLL